MKSYDSTEKNIRDLKNEVRNYIVNKLEEGMFKRQIATYQGDVVSVLINSCKNLDDKDLLTCKLSNKGEKCCSMINQKIKRKLSNWNNDKVKAKKICSCYEENKCHSTENYDSLLSKIITGYVDPAHTLAKANLDSISFVNKVYQ